MNACHQLLLFFGKYLVIVLLNYKSIVLFFAESLFMKPELLSFSYSFIFLVVEFPLMLPRPPSLDMYNVLRELNREQEVVDTIF